MNHAASRWFLLVAAWIGFGALFVVVPQSFAQKKFADGQILVKFKANVAEDKRANTHRNFRAEIAHRFKTLPDLQLVRLRKGVTVAQAVEFYTKSGLVEFAEPDYIISIGNTPNDPKFTDGTLWGLHNTGQNGGTADADIDAPEAWNKRTDASTVIVAVIDSGARYTHEDLAANMWTNPGEIPGNNIDDDGNGIKDDVHGAKYLGNQINGDPNDDNGHGSHVAGIVGAVGNNGKGVVGVCWNVRIMALKFLNNAGNGNNSDAIKCIDYAIAKGAHIISASWGGGAFSSSVSAAITRARNAGILFVAAAGNGGSDNIGDNNDAAPFYPSSYTHDNILAVASTDRNDLRSTFSNFGTNSVDIGAPGSSVYSCVHNSDTSYGTKSGTSMAAPCVAGAAALIKAHLPQLDYLQLKERLLATVDPIGSLTGITVSGGRLNLHRALTEGVTPAQIAVEPASHNFGTFNIGESATFDFVISNSGSEALSGNVVVALPFSVVGTDAYNVYGGASATVTLRFNATSGGAFNEIATFTGGGGATVSLSAIAQLADVPVIAVTPLNHDLGNVVVGESATQSFTVANLGNGTLEGSAATTAPFSIVSGGDYALGAGASATVVVKFEPPTTGAFNASVTFSGGGGASATVGGFGLAPAQIAVTPASQDFGTITVGQTAEREFVVTNLGSVAFAGTASVPAPFEILSGAGYNLSGGASGTVTVRFVPTGAGIVADIISFTGGGGTTASVSGFGAPLPAEISVEPASHDFGIVPVGDFADFNFTVRNLGSVTLDGVAATDAPFSIVGGSPYSIEGGGSASVTVRIAPTSVGTNSGTAAFSGGGGASVTLSATAIQPDLVISAINVTPVSGTGNSSATLSVTVANIGSQAAGEFRLDVWRDLPTFSPAPSCGQTGSVTEIVAGLAAGASVTFTYQFNRLVATGNYLAQAFVDSQCAIAESNEVNNTATSAYSVTIANLMITGMTLTPTTGLPGAPATVEVTIANLGNAPAGSFKLGMWFDKTEPPDCGATANTTTTISSLDAGASLTFSYNFNFAVALNSHRVWAFVDSHCEIPESNEAYQQKVHRTYTVRGADVSVLGMQITPAIGLPNTPATLSVTLRNVGNEPASNFDLAVWFDRKFAPNCGNPASATTNIASLAASGGTVKIDFPFTRSANLGTVFTRAFVDSNCALPEPNETNNQSSLTCVTTLPNLHITGMTVTPESGVAGTTATVTVTIANVGSIAAPAFRVDTWFDRPSAPDCGETGNVSRNFNWLAAGASVTFTNPFTFGATTGVHRVWSFVDSHCTVPETNENYLQKVYRAYSVNDVGTSSLPVENKGTPTSP